MNLPDTLTDRQRECVEAYILCSDSEWKAAKYLGIDLKALRSNLWLSHKKGVIFNPDTYCEHAPVGFQTSHSTIQSNKDGVVQRWDRIKPILPNEKEIFEYLQKRTPVSKLKVKNPKNVDPNIQLEWTLADCHFGMLAWDKESGEDYDINIARELILDSASEVFARSGKVKETVLVLMGDNFHTDFKSNQTEKSHHSLDVDYRYPKIVLTGTETYISAIEICLQYSERVKVIVLYGNHDAQTSVNLQLMLHFYFMGVNDRVTVDLSPAKEHYNFWGSVGTIFHHGDGTKPQRVCSQLMHYIAAHDVTGIKYFYAKQAHLHRESIEDINGVIYEIVPSPVAKDQYAAGANFNSKRATVATKYHKVYGDVDRYSISPHGLQMKKEMA